MFEEPENQAVDSDELSEEELTQIKATPHCENDWRHSVVTSVVRSQGLNANRADSAGSFPEHCAYLLNPLV